MSRHCVLCGTEFNESLDDFKRGISTVDKIPECWRNNKENGHCINCCNCHK